MAPGLYRAMPGNQAIAWGLLAAAQRSTLPVVYGAYPITPASGILEALAMHKRFRIRTSRRGRDRAVTAASAPPWRGPSAARLRRPRQSARQREGTARAPPLRCDLRNPARRPSTGAAHNQDEQGGPQQASKSQQRSAKVWRPLRRRLLYIAYGRAHGVKSWCPCGHQRRVSANGSEPGSSGPRDRCHHRSPVPHGEGRVFVRYLRRSAHSRARGCVRHTRLEPASRHREADAPANPRTIRQPTTQVRTAAEKCDGGSRRDPQSINGRATGAHRGGWGGNLWRHQSAGERERRTASGAATPADLNRFAPTRHILGSYPGARAGDQQRGQLGGGCAAGMVTRWLNRVRGLPLASDAIYESITTPRGDRMSAPGRSRGVATPSSPRGLRVRPGRAMVSGRGDYAI